MVIPRSQNRRSGRLSVVYIEGLALATTSAYVERLGFGLYQYLLICALGLSSMAESMELGAASSLNAALGHAYGLTVTQRAVLVATNLLAEGLGNLLAGPLCDTVGRRTTLLVANATLSVAILAIASLPTSIGFVAICFLRGVSGLMLGMMMVSHSILAIESTTIATRSVVAFAITFITYFGYLGTAVLLKEFMPGFGDSPSDAWRSFALALVVPLVFSFVATLVLAESPYFLAVAGDETGCWQALQRIAKWNGRAPGPLRLPSVGAADRGERGLHRRLYHQLMQAAGAIGMFPSLFALFVMMDSSRTFFTSGFIYVSKDIFEAVGSEAFPGTTLNILASGVPFVGLLIGASFLRFGKGMIVFGGGVVAASCICGLSLPALHHAPISVLFLMLVGKLTLAPMLTCVRLMKTEAFPTEVRGCIVAVTNCLARAACGAAPVVAELVRGESSTAWGDGSLDGYLRCMAVAAVTCAVLALAAPKLDGDGAPLVDFVKREPLQQEAGSSGDDASSSSSRSSKFNIWAEAPRGSGSAAPLGGGKLSGYGSVKF